MSVFRPPVKFGRALHFTQNHILWCDSSFAHTVSPGDITLWLLSYCRVTRVGVSIQSQLLQITTRPGLKRIGITTPFPGEFSCTQIHWGWKYYVITSNARRPWLSIRLTSMHFAWISGSIFKTITLSLNLSK